LDAGFHSNRPSLLHPRRNLNNKNEKPGEYRGKIFTGRRRSKIFFISPGCCKKFKSASSDAFGFGKQQDDAADKRNSVFWLPAGILHTSRQ
jgi:hypothetical protein